MAIEKVIRTQDAEENTISGRYSIKEGAVIVSAPDGSRLKAWAGANAEATAKMLLRECHAKIKNEFVGSDSAAGELPALAGRAPH